MLLLLGAYDTSKQINLNKTLTGPKPAVTALLNTRVKGLEVTETNCTSGDRKCSCVGATKGNLRR